MDIEKVRLTAEKALEGRDAYVVECTISPSNEITLVIDSDTAVSVDDCAELNHRISGQFDRDVEDYELMVASAGVGEPLRLLRQYRRLVGGHIDVVMSDGEKIIGTLKDAGDEGITVTYEEKVAVEGRKRKETRTTERFLRFDAIKTAREFLDFK